LPERKQTNRSRTPSASISVAPTMKQFNNEAIQQLNNQTIIL
jgi:hypothetical protein